MTEELQDSLVDLLVRQLDSAVTAADMVDWATAALSAGLDTPALVVLAGLPRRSSLFEAEPWFERALAELGVELPLPDDLRRAYVGVVSRAVLARTCPSDTALDLIHRHAVNPLAHPADLAPWCYVWEGLAPSDFRTLNAAGVEHETQTLASDWARRATFGRSNHIDRGA